ncbi:MAG: DUF1738 domain-containing protein [Desulfobulbaceae bacterium]|nr:DUF1738 domain-containing protein [Desulfobulbaceae bacterium]
MGKSNDLYARITAEMIEGLKKGYVPWVRPWSTCYYGNPQNAVSKRQYRGINFLLLNLFGFLKHYADPRWLTFKQALHLGGCVRKGEKGSQVVFWKQIPIKKDDDDEDDEKKTIPVAKTFTVFNVEQCDGLSLAPLEPYTHEPGAVNSNAEAILNIAEIEHGGDSAHYRPSRDLICLPNREAFADLDAYYSVGYHELVHWTGHENRLNRELGNSRFGNQAYAFEELIAEMGAAFLGGATGLPYEKMQHPQYIASWILLLENFHRAIFSASAQAQRAADFILERAGIVEEDVEVEQEEQAVAA